MRSGPSMTSASEVLSTAPKWLAVFLASLLITSSMSYLFFCDHSRADSNAAAQEEQPLPSNEDQEEELEAEEEKPSPSIAGFWMPHLISWADGTSANKEEIDERFTMRLYNYLETDGESGWICLDSRRAYATISENPDETWPFELTSEYGVFRARIDEDEDVLLIDLGGVGRMYLHRASKPENLYRFVD